jgi:hypothetical protein
MEPITLVLELFRSDLKTLEVVKLKPPLASGGSMVAGRGFLFE